MGYFTLIYFAYHNQYRPDFTMLFPLISGTTDMYPGYGIVYKNEPFFWSLQEYVPCAYFSVPYIEISLFANGI